MIIRCRNQIVIYLLFLHLFLQTSDSFPDFHVPSSTIEEYLAQNMKEGETLGFDGRVVTASYGKKLEKALKEKHVVIRYEKDVAPSQEILQFHHSF